MAMFGRNGSFSDLVRKLQGIADRGGPELYDLLDQVVNHEDAQPRKLAWMLTAGQSAIREQGRKFVGEAGSDAIDVLLQAMAGADREVQRELAHEVLKNDRAVLKRPVSRIAGSRRVEVLQTFLAIVNADPDWKTWLVPLKRLVDHADPALCKETVRLLGRDMNDDTVRLALRPLVHHDDEGLRSSVISAFCDAPKVDIVEPFFARLGKESSKIREKMVRTLGSLARDPDAHLEEHLGPVLADEDAEVRSLAVNVLSHLPDRTTTLRAALLHVRGLAPWLRERATQTLLSKASLLVEPAIALMGDQDADVRAAAMALAGEVRDPKIVPTLRDVFLGEGDWWVRSMAADLLTRFPSDDLVDTLMTQFENDDLRFAVISAIAKIEGAASIERMVAFLRDQRGGVVSAALRGVLDWSRDGVPPDVTETVTKIARDDERPWLRARAADVLRSWGEEGERKARAIEAQRQPDDPMAGAEIVLEMKPIEDDERKEPAAVATSAPPAHPEPARSEGPRPGPSRPEPRAEPTPSPSAPRRPGPGTDRPVRRPGEGPTNPLRRPGVGPTNPLRRSGPGKPPQPPPRGPDA